MGGQSQEGARAKRRPGPRGRKCQEEAKTKRGGKAKRGVEGQEGTNAKRGAGPIGGQG